MNPASGRHASHGPVAQYLWKISPWDHRAHAYREPLGEVVSAAICTHSARTSKLAEDDGRADRCTGCLIVIGRDLRDPGRRGI